MLVLSRGRNDKIVFPNLGISVEILRILGNRVRVGVEAPKDVLVLRDEVSKVYEPARGTTGGGPSTRDSAHVLRNRLQKATLGLHIVQRMLENGDTGDVEPILFKMFNELKAIEESIAAAEPPARAGRRRFCDTALIVDDDANESELLAGYLRLTGFEVGTALDGMQAMVRLAEGKHPDIVLLDMQMPRFDGRKTVSAIRQDPNYQSLKIFAVTGSESAGNNVPIGPSGVNRWFTKPVNPQLLVDAINEEIGRECLATCP